jgi:hypothetical protein
MLQSLLSTRCGLCAKVIGGDDDDTDGVGDDDDTDGGGGDDDDGSDVE